MIATSIDIEKRASRQLTADLVNAIGEAVAKDTVHQAAMLMAVIEVLANHSSDAHCTAIAGVMLETARRLDADAERAGETLEPRTLQ